MKTNQIHTVRQIVITPQVFKVVSKSCLQVHVVIYLLVMNSPHRQINKSIRLWYSVQNLKNDN